ncbi:sporulation protein SpoOM [Romboutsia weinsteinii]|uniref:Sporulation protein SpoOM n=1 Tax=Romboutsia weinsteinii TaxID=2020949 RepID=A0A371J1T4_9FIRM|nr:sporulation protein [Romboutsia weinsteinii]RDY26740.1 sporulation protein SpoOM [Romboutsia weinsteinii]
MSIFNKVMASALGIGATKIDTMVQTKNLMPGKRIEGICKITGGKIEQYINQIAIGVYTGYQKEVDDKVINESQCIQTHYIKVERNIMPGEVCEVDFSFILYKRVPVTKHRSKVWLSTYLDIEKGVDTSDRDYLNIDYNDYMKNVVDAIDELGFSIREIENEYCKAKLNGFKLVQEFEFVPTRGYFRGRLDELELVFIPTNQYVDILLQIDRKARGIMSFISESMGMDETNLRIRIENSRRYTVDELKFEIDNVLRRYS